MSDICAVSVCAVRVNDDGEPVVHHEHFLTRTLSSDDAVRIAYDYAARRFPFDQGWVDTSVAVLNPHALHVGVVRSLADLPAGPRSPQAPSGYAGEYVGPVTPPGDR